MGDLVGLDYPAARIIWDYAGIKFDSETFKGIMIFSRTVVEEINKKRSKKDGR